ncbi:CHAT domain-containing tetratricopeptide repeat protein [uncultured Aquimarina sp.]|uniref:CHAT domain-containing protein n=1 Tax=uncultured Aquimarina sp. TaxID=575652 RepID=UPI00261830F4|nr:CHAT domain-containing tetratricopeptide repeat protein [uncultured Aquimarina sp.]
MNKMYYFNKVRKGMYFPFLFYVLYFSLNLHLYGQKMSPVLDSILISSENDTIKKRLYTQLFDNYKNKNDYTQLGTDAHELAKWHYKKKNKKSTLFYAQLAIDAKKKAIPFDKELLKNSYINLGYIFYKYENYQDATKAFKKAVPFKKKSLNIRAYNYLANSYHKLQDPYNAVENRLKVFQYLDPLKDQQKIIKNHIKLAFSYRSMGQMKTGKQVVRHLLLADSIIKRIQNSDKKDKYLIKLNIGVEYHENGDIDYIKNGETKNLITAISYYKEAVQIAKEIKSDYYLCSSYYNLGLAYIELDMVIAKEYFDKSLALVENRPELLKSIYFGYGKLAYKESKYDKAINLYQESIAGFFNEQKPNIGWQPTKEQLTRVEKKSLLLRILKTKIKTHLDQGIDINNQKSYLQALKTLETADKLIEIMLTSDASYKTKLRWRDLASEVYIIGLEACYQGNLLDKAFYLMEKNKALLLMQDLNRSKDELPTTILEKELAFKSKIASLGEQKQGLSDQKQDSLSILIFDKKEELQRFHDSIAEFYPEYFLSKEIPDVLSLSQIKAKKDEVVIQYTMAERIGYTTPYGYGMLLSDQENKIFKLENIDTLLNNIKTLREQLHKPFTTKEDINAYKMISNSLYKSLFPKEIRASLKDKKITIIPDHMLGMIPFEALITDIDKNRYLIEDNEINYAFSLTFQEKNASIVRKADQDFLGIAPVNFTNQLTPLKNSTKEITYANDLYDGTLLLDKEATKENFIKEIKNYKILHLATHADASDSIAPWIAFRNSKLTDLELNSLQSQAELVVLSACNTSLGKISRGEGVLSLARGFFKSGANTVIPSLWSTNDKATATITSDFYKNLSEGQTKSAALRAAKLTYLNNNTDAEASPHYWASLVLIGDSGTLLPTSDYTIFILIGIALLLIILLSMFIYRK